MRKAQGRSFPRDVQLGFNYDTMDHKREEMSQGKPMQTQFLNGPQDIPWIVDTDFTKSVQQLCEPQLQVAYAACHERINDPIYASYGRRIGGGVDFVKATKKNFFSGYEKLAPIVAAHRKALVWLGELHRVIVRCIENEFTFDGQIRDLRLTDPFEVNSILDELKIPQTNEQNPYSKFGVFGEFPFSAKWFRQQDEQIDQYHELLGIK